MINKVFNLFNVDTEQQKCVTELCTVLYSIMYLYKSFYLRIQISYICLSQPQLTAYHLTKQFDIVWRHSVMFMLHVLFLFSGHPAAKGTISPKSCCY